MIPSLLLRGTGLVKTTRFAAPRYIGDPINAVRIFNDKEADELFILAIDASKQAAPPNYALLERIVSEAFMPIGYGGGICQVDQARRLLQLGIEKVIVNTAALKNRRFITELAETFGSQCVVGAIDVKRRWLGRGYVVHSHASEAVSEPDPLAWALKLVEAGAGEILIQSVDRDGTMTGFELELMRRFDSRLRVPLVAAGGAGGVDDMADAILACRLSGIAVGARFVYQGPRRGVLINYLSRPEIEKLQRLIPGDSSREVP